MHKTLPPLRVCLHLLKTARTDVRCMRIAATLVTAGYAVTVIDIEEDSTRPAEEVIDGIHLKHIIAPRWYVPTRFKPLFFLKWLPYILRATRLLLQTEADVYHAQVETALPACYLAARLRQKPLIFEAYELPLDNPNLTCRPTLHAIASSFLTKLLSSCSATITVCSPIAEEIRRRFGGPEVTLIRNVPGYREVAKSDRLRQHLGLGPQVRIALFQGFLQENRGLDRLIRAARFLERDMVIVLLGRPEQGMQSFLETLIERECVADRVKLVPAVPYQELLEWTASADIGLTVLPLDQSLNVRWSLPNKVFEYLMAGLPILSSPVDAIAALVQTYDVGRVVSSLSPADVGAAINAMLADKRALDRMQRNALAAVQTDLCWEKEQQHLLSVYQRIFGNPNEKIDNRLLLSVEK